jgi:chromosome segregation ATPase
VATGVNSEIERRMAELVRTSPALAALDAMGRRTQSASGRVDSLGAELVGLAAECAELRARVAAAEQKRDASRTQMQHVLAAARHELQQLRELTGATV